MANFDLVRPQPQRQPVFTPPPKRKSRKWKWLLLLLILAGIGFAGVRFILRTNKVFTSQHNIFTRVGNLLISPDKPLIGEEEGRVNVLLMGVGGNGHDGAYLTDTMIVAQINTKTNEVVLTSIPRDFSLQLPKIGFNKINAAYAYAYRDNPNTAGEAAINAAQEVTGLQIPYYAVIDFKGFVKAVDDVNGVDVTVANTFTDSEFPNDFPYDTKGYIAPVTFKKGPAHMDGHTALIFARSRHSDNPLEGSDFARSERQKKILAAMKVKVFSLNLTSLSTINNLLSDFTNNFRTNLEPYEMKRLMDIAKNISNDNIYSFSLEPQDNLICSELIDANTGQRIHNTTPPAQSTIPDANTPAQPVVPMYVVEPCEGKTLADIHAYVTTAPMVAKLKKEAAVIDIRNSTGKTSVLRPWQQLADLGVTVKFTPFTGRTPYTQTILYDNSQGGKPHTLDYLKNNFSFTVSDVTYPSSTADFVVVIGNDALQ